MTKPDLGLPSAIDNSTYQQNREIQMPAIAFMSKSELRKTIEWMFLEQKKLIELDKKRLDEEIRLREALRKEQKKTSHYQTLYLDEIDKNRDRKLKESINISYLKIAG